MYSVRQPRNGQGTQTLHFHKTHAYFIERRLHIDLSGTTYPRGKSPCPPNPGKKKQTNIHQDLIDLNRSDLHVNEGFSTVRLHLTACSMLAEIQPGNLTFLGSAPAPNRVYTFRSGTTNAMTSSLALFFVQEKGKDLLVHTNPFPQVRFGFLSWCLCSPGKRRESREEETSFKFQIHHRPKPRPAYMHPIFCFSPYKRHICTTIC